MDNFSLQPLILFIITNFKGHFHPPRNFSAALSLVFAGRLSYNIDALQHPGSFWRDYESNLAFLRTIL